MNLPARRVGRVTARFACPRMNLRNARSAILTLLVVCVVLYAVLGATAPAAELFEVCLDGDAALRDLVPPALLSPLSEAVIDSMQLTAQGNSTPLTFSSPYVAKWRAHPRLVVVGIQATDHAQRRVMRNAQRNSWMTYPDVARKANDFTGLLLVLFMQSVNTKQQPYVSCAMYEEMRNWEDTVTFAMETAQKSRSRPHGVDGSYGEAFEIFNTRKTILTFRYVYQTFPDTPFIAKSDDDTFIHVPELMQSLRSLPRVSTLYGKLMRLNTANFGLFYAMTRDVAWEIATHPGIISLTVQPYRSELWGLYKKFTYMHEDHMVGTTLRDLYEQQGRRAPTVPSTAAGLPVATGWGHHYLEYIRNNRSSPSEGSTATLPGNGAREVRYAFPATVSLEPGYLVFVADNCRMLHSKPQGRDGYGRVAQHRMLTAEDMSTAMHMMRVYGTSTAGMMRPTAFNVVAFKSFAYRVSFCDDSDPLSSS